MVSRLPLALTIGDPAGIGPDISLSAWRALRGGDGPAFFLAGSVSVLKQRADTIGLDVPVERISHPSDAARVFNAALPVLETDVAFADVMPGKSSTAHANGVIAAIDLAVDLTAAGEASGIVTSPIAKHLLYGSGFKYPGHTEYIAVRSAKVGPAHKPAQPPMPVMMLACDELRVVPATIHIPLADVPVALTAEKLEATCKIVADALRQDFAVAMPRIAVTGLNPHAGENGTIGNQDAQIIKPVIDRLAGDGMLIRGPVPADSLFHARARETYDAAIAMYHDQALIPIKTIAFDRAVNVTLGLPIVRTSPDHGTAFDVAGTGRANPTSLIEAIRLAAHIAANRARVQTA